VIPKELAFRGVLLGSTLHLWGTWRAVLITSVLFGLWHITTTLHTQSDNQTVRHASAALVVLGDVAVMAAARVIFCWLRLRLSSLVAPVLAHFATRLRGAVVPRRPPRAVIDARLAVNVAPHRTSPVPNQRAERP
jgi:membrane protease YdiL (CAAX protease family)